MPSRATTSDGPHFPSVRALPQRLVGAMSLVDVTVRLAAQHDEDSVLRTVTESVCDAIRCERASLFLVDEARQELRTRVVTELEIAEIRIPVGFGVAGWVAKHREVANIPDPPLDSRWSPDTDRRTGFCTQNILAAPLLSVVDGRLIGVLQLLNRLDGGFDEFDEKLVQAFAAHAATAIERGQLLEQARRSQELQLAVDMGRRIQTGFLPHSLPRIPGYSVAAWWQPAEHVSGDYYDVLPLCDGRIGLVVADVSGHGIGPSLIMASARAMLHVLCRTMSDPAQILIALSESITPDLQDGRFITFLIAALDPRTHVVTYANGGHAPALHRKAAASEWEALDPTTMPLGFDFLPMSKEEGSLELKPGDALVLATDGSVEFHDADQRMFGQKRFQQAVDAACTAGCGASAIVESVRERIVAALPTPLPPDDVTLLVISRDT